MPKYRLLLVEELVLSDCAEFHVDAPTEADAAAFLINARHEGLDRDSNLVSLPDGQSHNIEPEDIVRSRVFCVLLDEKGEEIREIIPDFTNVQEQQPSSADESTPS